jgi:L-seryl-tRNA(Ser) seleniumtransferase
VEVTMPRPPSVERVLAAARPALGPREADAILVEARAVVGEERVRLAAGMEPRSVDDLAVSLVLRLDTFGRPEDAPDPSSRGGTRSRGAADIAGIPRVPGAPAPVINATGVIVHTNLGRAAWSQAAIRAASSAAGAPSLLEMDPGTGRRGRRFGLAEEHVVALTGAGAALVATNNAAALAVVVGLAGRRGIAVSRGELVEIGGGVRIPEIIRRAGARLVEVGTTNRTRAADFADPLASGHVAMVLRVHPSNFRMEGFVESPDAVEVAAVAHAHGSIVVDDLGSGALLDTAAFGLAHEPTPAESLASGADLVLFSGDKLLGGPQAGIIAGRADLVARLRRDPLARATRPDKVILAALAATLGLYRAGLATREIPVWRAISRPLAEVEARGERVVALVCAELARSVPTGPVTARRARPAGARPRATAPAETSGSLDAPGASRGIRAVPTTATVGGGSLPGERIASSGVAVDPIAIGTTADRLAAALRTGEPAVIARVEDGRVLLDMRTIDPAAPEDVATALAVAIRAVRRR